MSYRMAMELDKTNIMSSKHKEDHKKLMEEFHGLQVVLFLLLLWKVSKDFHFYNWSFSPSNWKKVKATKFSVYLSSWIWMSIPNDATWHLSCLRQST